MSRHLRCLLSPQTFTYLSLNLTLPQRCVVFIETQYYIFWCWFGILCQICTKLYSFWDDRHFSHLTESNLNLNSTFPPELGRKIFSTQITWTFTIFLKNDINFSHTSTFNFVIHRHLQMSAPWADWVAFCICHHFLNLKYIHCKMFNLHHFILRWFSKDKVWPWRGWPAWGPRGSYQRQPLSAKLQQINDKLSLLQLYHVRAC